MGEESYKNLTLKELTTIFGRKKSEQEEIKKIILSLLKDGVIIEDKKHRFGLAERSGFIKGTISINSKGFGFVSSDGEEDVFIAPENTNYAMNNDQVLFKVHTVSDGKYKAEGTVKAVIKRNTDLIVGKFVKSKNFGFVVPADKRIQYDIFIPHKLSNGAANGDVVSCKIIKYASDGKKPEGMVLSIIGKEKNLFVDIKSELIQRKISETFPLKVQKQVAALPKGISKTERDKRKDFTSKLIYTIDGADSKDLDDAISVELLENGNYELGVYIADVSHYVSERSALDKEALQRGTSLYFADTVIPMLPEKLSNDLCSLNPNEEKLVLALIMEIDSKSKMHSYQIHEGIISSKFRLTYDEVTNYLDNNEGELAKKGNPQLLESLKLAEKLAEIIRKKRDSRGNINFDFPETVFEIKGNKVVGVSERKIGTSNEIIEDFMIISNETIAEAYYTQEIPFLYRIHESPKMEKLDGVYRMLDGLNIKPKAHRDGKVYPKDIQEIMDQLEDLPQKDMISYSLLRSMQKAKYSSEDTQHFGLASKYYTHFTSPIRRYPDLQIHRIIKEHLNGKLDINRIKHYEKILFNVAEVTSSAEVKAVDLERTVDDILKCYYMSDHIGEVFEGKIISLTSFGIFVQLSNSLEGLIRYADLNDDYYSYNPDTTVAEGERNQRKFKIGDKIDVKVDSVDFDFKEVRLSLYEKD